MDITITRPGALTIHATKILQEITHNAMIGKPIDPANPENGKQVFLPVRLVWDTGAMNSIIPEALVSRLGLQGQESGVIKLKFADIAKDYKTYMISLKIPGSTIEIDGIAAAAADSIDNEMLLGMDVIALGDFAVTNEDGKTCFSFAVPSSTSITFS